MAETKLGLSYENTKRLTERKREIDDTFEEILTKGILDSRKQINSELNKKVYDFAEKQGLSLWDVCFNYIPQYHPTTPKIENLPYMQKCNIGYEITLEPLYLELEEGPGYWKGKYYDLKRKMQELINSKE